VTLVVVSLVASYALAGGAASAKNEKHAHEKPAAQANAHAKGGAQESHPNQGKPEQAEEKAAKGEARRAEHAEFKSKLAELRERRAQGQLSPAELKKELAGLRASREERRREHREALRQRWGNQLAQPSAQEELQHHERRMARLERMALLAQNEPNGAKKDALVARIEKLTSRENERHERKMGQLEASANAKTAGAGQAKPEKQAAVEPATDKADEKGAVR
jgi:hypothetical protein